MVSERRPHMGSDNLGGEVIVRAPIDDHSAKHPGQHGCRAAGKGAPSKPAPTIALRARTSRGYVLRIGELRPYPLAQCRRRWEVGHLGTNVRPQREQALVFRRASRTGVQML